MAEEQTASTAYGDVQIPSEGSQPPEASAPEGAVPQSNEPWWKQHENSEIEFTAAGKAIKAPFSKVRQWAQQGYDYGQRMQAFNAQKAEFEASRAEFGKDQEWSEVAKYARDNPEWAQHTRQSWEQRQNWRNENTDNPLVRDFEAFKQEIAPLKQEVEAFRSERTRIQQETEDKALETEMGTVRDKYSKIGMDLSQIDPATGMSMEYSALKYGSENGIKSFKTAFLELYGDKAESLIQESAKKSAAEEFAKRQKDGFIGRTPTPQTGQPQKPQNVRSRSWASLQEEAARDVANYKP